MRPKKGLGESSAFSERLTVKSKDTTLQTWNESISSAKVGTFDFGKHGMNQYNAESKDTTQQSLQTNMPWSKIATKAVKGRNECR